MAGCAVYAGWEKVELHAKHFGYVANVAESLDFSMNVREYWVKSMRYGEKLGCHQRPDRSFFLKGYQMPVCARCTGAIIGYLIAVPGFFVFGFSWLASLYGCILLLVDWGFQALEIKASTNRRRLISGLVGGYGLMSFQLKVIQIMIGFIK